MIIMKFARKIIRNEKKVLVNGVQTPLIAAGVCKRGNYLVLVVSFGLADCFSFASISLLSSACGLISGA